MVTSPVWDMWPTVNKVVGDLLEGKFVAMDFREWSMMAKGGSRLAPYHGFEDKLPAEVKQAVVDRIEEIKSGAFRVPIITTSATSVRK